MGIGLSRLSNMSEVGKLEDGHDEAISVTNFGKQFAPRSQPIRNERYAHTRFPALCIDCTNFK